MAWLWPLTRDLRHLERSTTSFGNRNWMFDARIGMRSPIYPLAEAFRRMAARIDSLIGSQKDMSNAMSHEIKTPLARMRFEIEMARTAADSGKLAQHLNNINVDIAELDAFVKATLDYAILERAEVALNVGRARPHAHPARRRRIRPSATRATDLAIRCEVSAERHARPLRRASHGDGAEEPALQRDSIRTQPDSRDVFHPAGRRLRAARG